MRIIFCDDDQEILAQLTRYIVEFFHSIHGLLPEMKTFTSGDALLASGEQADIAFLDVEMPGLSGIRVGAELKERNPRIKIFIVTSYPDYLDEAMRFQVFRYLSKPIDKNRLFRNMKDALYQYNMETHPVPIQTNQGVIIRQADEIVCVETLQRKTYLYTTTEKIRTLENIEYWRNVLTLPCFYSTYRSFIINMKYVYTIEKDSIVLKYGGSVKTAYLSKRKYSNFKDTYLTYLESIK